MQPRKLPEAEVWGDGGLKRMRSQLCPTELSRESALEDQRCVEGPVDKSVDVVRGADEW